MTSIIDSSNTSEKPNDEEDEDDIIRENVEEGFDVVCEWMLSYIYSY